MNIVFFTSISHKQTNLNFQSEIIKMVWFMLDILLCQNFIILWHILINQY